MNQRYVVMRKWFDPNTQVLKASHVALSSWLLCNLLSPLASTSPDYGLNPAVSDFGGGSSTSLHYAQTASFDAAVQTGGLSTDYASLSGYIGAVSEYLGGALWAEWLVYNSSAWDGNDPNANAKDDQAVATDKVPLRRGGIGSFANYSSYSRGINAIMVDIPALPGAPTVNDFTFKVGNDNDPGSLAHSAGANRCVGAARAGTNGSDRVTLIWANNAIQKQWLEVTALPTANTGLAVSEVFYFGNAVGEAGNSSTDARVNANDILLARANQRTLVNPAPVDFRYDYNRDKKVDASDQLIARANQTTLINSLKLIDLSNLAPNSSSSLASFLAPAVPTSRISLGGSQPLADTSNSGQSPGSEPALVEVQTQLILSRLPNGGLLLEVRGPNAANVQLESTFDLTEGFWDVHARAQDQADTAQRWVIVPEQQQQFFRLQTSQ